MSVQQRFRDLAWKRDAGWREVVVIAAVIVLVVALIMLAR
jgi:anti-sigma-K factor RskA